MSDKEMQYQGRPIAPDINTPSCPEKDVYYCSGGVCEARDMSFRYDWTVYPGYLRGASRLEAMRILSLRAADDAERTIEKLDADLEAARAEIKLFRDELEVWDGAERVLGDENNDLRAKLARVIEAGRMQLDYICGCGRSFSIPAADVLVKLNSIWDAAVKEIKP